MEIHKNTNKQLNDLLHEARHEKPVMNLKEVENIISEGKYAPAGGSRGFHIGMNNMIVVCGIVVSSFLAYMALKVDSGELTTPVSTPSQAEVAMSQPASQPAVVPSVAVPANNTLTETRKPAAKPLDRVQPKQNPATLLASASENLVATDNGSGAENVEPVVENVPIVEYTITFNYNGQDVSMKLVGDKISEFSVDGHAVTSDQYSDYADILAEGKNYIIGNTHAEKNSSSLNLIKYFDGQLRSDNILNNQVHYLFELTSSQLIVNGNVQPDEIFKKYRGLYESKTGKKVTEGSVYKFERGAKSE